MSAHSDVRLSVEHDPADDALVLHMRLASDDPEDAPRVMRVPSAERARLRELSAHLREGKTAFLPDLHDIWTALIDEKGEAPEAPCRAFRQLFGPGPKAAVPSTRRLIVEGGEAGEVLWELVGAGPSWPGLSDHWQWLRYVQKAGAAQAMPHVLAAGGLRALCVIGSHEMAAHVMSARHAAVAVLRALRELGERVRFLISAAEIEPLRATATSVGFDDFESLLRQALVAPDAGVLLEEIARGQELLLWLGHSDAVSAMPATALLLAGQPATAPPEQRVGFEKLGKALDPSRTRFCALLACRAEPSLPALLLERVDHVVVTDGFVPVEGASRFARALVERLAALDPAGEAVRAARAQFAAHQRWHVQYWTRNLDPRPFVDREARAVAEYLAKVPTRPQDEESPLFAAAPDWHLKRAVELQVELEGQASKHHRWQLDERMAERYGIPRGFGVRRDLPSLRDLLSAPPSGDRPCAPRWLVLGEPGSGKSTMLQRERVLLAAAADRAFVPVFVRLAHWARDELGMRGSREHFEIEDYVEERFQMAKRGLAEGLLARARRGEVCYLLDGLDEVPDQDGKDARVTELLRKLAEERPLCPIVVSSRPIEARNYTLAEYRRAEIAPLSETKQLELLERRFDGDRNRAQRLLAGLADNPTVQQLARNPLFLTLFAMSSKEGSRQDLRPHEVLDDCIKDLLEGKHRRERIDWPAGATLNRRLAMLVELAYAATSRLSEEVDEDALVEALAKLDPKLEELKRCLRLTGLLRLASCDGLVSNVWAFDHRLLQEALVSRELAARWARGGGDRDAVHELARELCAGDGETRERRLHFWAEPFALMAGRVGEHGPDAIVQTLIDEPETRPIGLRALVNAHRLEPDTIALAFERLEDWQDRRRVIEGLIERVPKDQLVPLLARLARLTSEGNDLYFLWLQLERLEALGGPRATQARIAREQLFDHLEPSVSEMRAAFLHVPGRPECPAFCHVGPGVFDMGDDQEGFVRGVRIEREFWIGATAVTVGQYRLFDPKHRCGATGEAVPVVVDSPEAQRERDRFPVVDVTWYAALSFTRWLNRWQKFLPREPLPQEDLDAKLPTEARWEYAARAGGKSGQRFWFGENDDELKRHGRSDDGWAEGPFPVASASEEQRPSPNPWGLFDVHGGVWEWCLNEYEGERRTDELGPSSSASSRVLRGGSFDDLADLCRSAVRFGFHPAVSSGNVGFRVVLAVRPPARPIDPR